MVKEWLIPCDLFGSFTNTVKKKTGIPIQIEQSRRQNPNSPEKISLSSRRTRKMSQRHSKNNNDLAFFTHDEKPKLGYGTQKERLRRDSIKSFDVCSLCLKPFIKPMSCLKGHFSVKSAFSNACWRRRRIYKAVHITDLGRT
ncbi:nitric oxide synthase-interacting protein homolog [Striga asiatica]|uniref:Nitric oxide synthase-interacting protein homolog n=1 Tax=Striga asiatica TaxID=4170 RepID=A0A5A7R9Q5_STRAF|nr:nitric oxide synthase-interacting protein homolog [Striga asiatica]